MIKNDANTLILNGGGTYSGGTTINAGKLVVGSSGALGNGFVANNATLQTTATATPGFVATAPLTIGVKGAYMQTAAATLLLQVATSPAPTPSNNSGIAGSNYDTLSVTGSAFLGGALNLTFAPASVPSQGQRYVAVQSAAAPVVGQFTNSQTDTTGLPASFITVTTYNDNFGNPALNNSVIVSLLQPFTSAYFPGLTPNQNNVGIVVTNNLVVLNNSGQLNNPTGTNKDFFNNIINGVSVAGNSGSLGAALDQLSPQRFEILRNVAFDNYALDMQNLDDEFARERNGQGGIDTSGFAFNDSRLGPQLSQIKSRLLAWSPPADTGLLSDSGQLVLGGVQMNDPKDMKDMTLQALLNRWNGFVDGGVDLGDLDGDRDVNNSSYINDGCIQLDEAVLPEDELIGAKAHGFLR